MYAAPAAVDHKFILLGLADFIYGTVHAISAAVLFLIRRCIPVRVCGAVTYDIIYIACALGPLLCLSSVSRTGESDPVSMVPPFLLNRLNILCYDYSVSNCYLLNNLILSVQYFIMVKTNVFSFIGFLCQW